MACTFYGPPATSGSLLVRVTTSNRLVTRNELYRRKQTYVTLSVS